MSLDSEMKNLVVFASGSGSNAVNTCKHFKNHPEIRVTALFCNNPSAGVLDKMIEFGVPVVLFTRDDFRDPAKFLNLLDQYKPDLIALLGFLWKVPSYMIEAYPQRIINLHPALLPKYGGKGMYGHFVHEAVKNAGETISGITIHYVNEHFDEGPPIAQFSSEILPEDTADDIASKIHILEMQYVPGVIERVMLNPRM